MLLSPAIAMILFGAERIGQHMGIVAMVAGVVLFVVLLQVEARKAGRALIDLRQFHNRTFTAAARWREIRAAEPAELFIGARLGSTLASALSVPAGGQ